MPFFLIRAILRVGKVDLLKTGGFDNKKFADKKAESRDLLISPKDNNDGDNLENQHGHAVAN